MPEPLSEATMKSRVKVIQGAVACSEEEALMALEGAEGDVNGALQLLDLLVKDILIVKFRFASRRASSVSGLGYLAADARSGKLISVNTVATYRITLSEDVAADLPWRVIESTISGLRDSSDINLHATLDLDAHLLHSLQPWRIEELGRFAREGKRGDLQDAMRSELVKGLREDAMADVDFELLTRVQFGQSPDDGAQLTPQEAEEKDQDSEDGMMIFLQSDLLVSPIDGQTVDSLVSGQTVLARITDDSQIGTYLATLLGGRNGPEAVPLAAPVTRVEKLASGRVRVELRFGPGVMGKAICESGIKVQAVSQPAEAGPEPDRFPWAWVIAFAACLVLFLVLIVSR